VLEVSEARLSSDGGLLVIREFDERIGLTARIAAALVDTRHPVFTRHTLRELVRQRLYGLLADYEDQNDHDELRSDPVFKLVAGRLPDDPDLASQPTLSRFENAVTIADLWRLRDALVDLFLDSFDEPPTSLTFDIDAFDDPAHGQQQLTFFHGYYEQNQYLPIALTCAENDQVLLVGLRHGTASAALGADDDLRYLLTKLRGRWPDVRVHVRGDSGYGTPVMYAVCEELGLTYTFGLGMNSRLKTASDATLSRAIGQYEQTGEKARLFTSLWYRADSWDRERFVIVKAEAHAQGTNRRAVVTNRPGARVLPEAAYDEYAARGESENRNKELKRGLCADRLSDHRFLANFFRLYLHTAALNLLTRLRRAVTKTPTPRSLGIVVPLPIEALPIEALPEPNRKSFFNRRRREDPLGEGQPCTWRSRLIKVACEVFVSARRVVVKLASSWPHLEELFRVAGLVAVNTADG
jgi:hypothetical protein